MIPTPGSEYRLHTHRSNPMTTMTKARYPSTSPEVQTPAGFPGAIQEELEALGVRYGIFEVMAQVGPVTAAELAGCTGLSEKHLGQWLRAQAVNDRLYFNAPAQRYCFSTPWLPGSRR